MDRLKIISGLFHSTILKDIRYTYLCNMHCSGAIFSGVSDWCPTILEGQSFRSFFKSGSDCFLGDLERLRRFWLTGTCNPKKEEKKASEPLAPEQFLSAFFLLMCGICLATGLMGLEHAYIRWIRGRVVKTDKAGCCALVSRVSSFVS